MNQCSQKFEECRLLEHRVDLLRTDVSEERVASIFRVEKSASEEPAWAGGTVEEEMIYYFTLLRKWR
jgi:hypothetical protein